MVPLLWSLGPDTTRTSRRAAGSRYKPIVPKKIGISDLLSVSDVEAEIPEGPSTQCLGVLVPNDLKGMVKILGA